MKSLILKTGDGRHYVRLLQRYFGSETAALDALDKIVPKLAAQLGRQPTEDELRKGRIHHDDPRTERERMRDDMARRATLTSQQPAPEGNPHRKVAEHLEQRKREKQLAGLAPLDRAIHDAKAQADQWDAEQEKRQADEARKSDPAFQKAMASAREFALLLAFNPRVTQGQLEEAEHQVAQLENTGDVESFRLAQNALVDGLDQKYEHETSEFRRAAESAKASRTALRDTIAPDERVTIEPDKYAGEVYAFRHNNQQYRVSKSVAGEGKSYEQLVERFAQPQEVTA